MKFKNSLLAITLFALWIIEHGGSLSFATQIGSAEVLSNFNAVLMSVVGILFFSYTTIIYSSAGALDIQEHTVLRYVRRRYIFHCFKEKCMDSFYVAAIYSIINLSGNILFVKASLLISSRYMTFFIAQFLGVWVYVLFLCSISVFLWLICQYKKVFLWLTAVLATFLCICPATTVVHPLNSILTNRFLTCAASLYTTFISMLLCLSYCAIFLILAILLFKNRDITKAVAYEK